MNTLWLSLIINQPCVVKLMDSGVANRIQMNQYRKCKSMLFICEPNSDTSNKFDVIQATTTWNDFN